MARLWFHDEDAKFGKPDKFAIKGGSPINPKIVIPKRIVGDCFTAQYYSGPWDLRGVRD